MEGLEAMERTVSSRDFAQQSDDLLEDVSVQGDRYVVERDGVPLAAVIPFALYAQWKRRREAFFQLMRETAKHADLSEEDAIRVTDEAKHAVRSQS
jgi:PHD/YefM family antitoxin component YafN of YafNO toxin-antitoxin module